MANNADNSKQVKNSVMSFDYICRIKVHMLFRITRVNQTLWR